MQKQASQSTDKRNRGRRKRPITLAMAFLLENDDQIFEAALSFVDEFKLDAEGGNQSGKLDEETINSTDE
ncbi:hypothetical protein PC122_g5504 [Phytophthora cactorum]|nr:hypothetical protein PC122_g5504 [Phytophthora cactorum]